MTRAQTARLTEGLKTLRMATIRKSYREQAELARKETLSYEAYLLELVDRECETRTHNRIERLVRESRLPLEKSLETFDRKRLPTKVSGLVSTLLEGDFLDRSENVLAFGNPGSGKTHLVCAIAQHLIQQGRRVLFTPCNLLVQQLLLAKRELDLPRLLKRWDRCDALVLDDIGYVQHSREEMEVLFALLSHRYERGSIMITSNLPFSKWEQIFKDEMTTAAAIDRLVHHCVILELNLPSYRLEHSKTGRKGNPSDSKSAA
jgi:DNA replication protein DnaC|tara:strand:+ start:371 stop:1153 length:783 start_codon:yes stop_codon:yes gene_type:complete